VPVKVFWLERTDRVKVWLRRYRSECPKGKKTGTWTEICEAHLTVHENASASRWGRWKKYDGRGPYWSVIKSRIPMSDRRWRAMRCERCGGAFDRTCAKQVWAEHLHRGCPDGTLYTLRDAPVGAMWDLEWLHDVKGEPWTGPDGIALSVRTPGGDWYVDGRASNCTLPNDHEHYCWVRHGDPRTGNVHVDKNGRTCAAGAGSIAIGSYHGFLQNGYLT
jgi:hypothetical protein